MVAEQLICIRNPHVCNAKSPGARKLDGACAKILGGDLLSHMMICSIIGDKELNCRVRNGIGCTLLSMAAKKSL